MLLVASGDALKVGRSLSFMFHKAAGMMECTIDAYKMKEIYRYVCYTHIYLVQPFLTTE